MTKNINCVKKGNDYLITTANIQGVNRNWFNPLYWQDKDAIVGHSQGRHTTYFIELSKACGQHDAPIGVLRHYYRGGMVAKLSKNKFVYRGLESTRAYREFNLLNDMIALGLPVPKPVAAIITKHGLLYSNSIIIERIDDCQDAFHILTERPMTEMEWQSIGKLIKLIHRHHVHHTDMNIHNILMDENGKCWMIDFDKCAFNLTSQSWQAETLARLKRSLEKELRLNTRFHYDEECWTWLMAGYEL